MNFYFRYLFDPPLVRVADEFFVSFPTVRSGEELGVRVCLCLYSGVLVFVFGCVTRNQLTQKTLDWVE